MESSSGIGDDMQTQMVNDLIDNFDEISGGSNTITASDLQSAFQNGTMGPNSGSNKAPQDPKQ